MAILVFDSLDGTERHKFDLSEFQRINKTASPDELHAALKRFLAAKGFDLKSSVTDVSMALISERSCFFEYLKLHSGHDTNKKKAIKAA